MAPRSSVRENSSPLPVIKTPEYVGTEIIEDIPRSSNVHEGLATLVIPRVSIKRALYEYHRNT